MPKTYKAIASQTLTGTETSVTFSSIPQTYTDLVFILNPIGTSSGANYLARFNSDTGANYDGIRLTANGSTVASARYTITGGIQIHDYLINGTSQVPVIICQIMNYSNTTTYKQLYARGNTASNWVQSSVGVWKSTSAITSVTFLSSSSNFQSGSSFSLYGIKAA